MIALEVTAIIALLILLGVSGLHIRGLLGGFLIIQAVYWSLDYAVRPVLLLLSQPSPQIDDPIADPRLAATGYELALGTILPAVILGIATYAAIATASRRINTHAEELRRIRSRHAATLIGIGWGFRILSTVAPGHDLFDTLTTLATVGVGLLIVFPDRGRNPLLYLALGSSELAWSVVNQSKAPILALFLWVLVRALATSNRISMRRAWPFFGFGAGAFILVQNAKIAAGRLTGTAAWESSYPFWIQPFLLLLQRFDGLRAVTDAAYAGTGSWISPMQAAGKFLTALVPSALLGTPKTLAGSLWGLEVRPHSLPGSTASAHLAEGPIAEGWILGGYGGVIVECTLVALALVLIVRLLRGRSLYVITFALAFTSQPYLFERGLLGIGEGIGKSLQVALVAWFLLKLLEFAGSRRQQLPRNCPARQRNPAYFMAGGYK